MKPLTHLSAQTNTYALLLDANDAKQNASETVVYLLLIGIAAFSMWFAAQQPIRLPIGATSVHHSAPAAV